MAHTPLDQIDLRALVDRTGNLTDREKEVLLRRFGLKGWNTPTLEKLGIRFGVTRERIRQIQEKAIRKVRNQIREERRREEIEDMKFYPLNTPQNLIRNARKERGWNQLELSKRVTAALKEYMPLSKISESQITKIETGRQEPPDWSLAAFGAVLNIEEWKEKK